MIVYCFVFTEYEESHKDGDDKSDRHRKTHKKEKSRDGERSHRQKDDKPSTRKEKKKKDDSKSSKKKEKSKSSKKNAKSKTSRKDASDQVDSAKSRDRSIRKEQDRGDAYHGGDRSRRREYHDDADKDHHYSSNTHRQNGYGAQDVVGNGGGAKEDRWGADAHYGGDGANLNEERRSFDWPPPNSQMMTMENGESDARDRWQPRRSGSIKIDPDEERMRDKYRTPRERMLRKKLLESFQRKR